MTLSAEHKFLTAHYTDPAQQVLHVPGYIVDTEATLALITTSQESMVAWVQDVDKWFTYDGANWIESGSESFYFEAPVLDKDLTTAPGSPSLGDRYIVGAVATTGDPWFGHDDEIAEWNGSNWDFTVPAEGAITYVDDENIYYLFNGTSWGVFAQSPLTTKGDLYSYSTSAGRFPVGANNTLLIADSTQAFGLRWAQVDLATMVTGVLPVANGGTSGATALAGFNALSPLTTQGDLLTRNATDNIRLALGVANRVLRSDGTNPSWAQVALATDVTGTLGPTNGGTGLSSFAATSMLYASGANVWAATALEYTQDGSTVAMDAGTRNLTWAGDGSLNSTFIGDVNFTSTGGNSTFTVTAAFNFVVAAATRFSITTSINHFVQDIYSGVTAPGAASAGQVRFYKDSGTNNQLFLKGEDAFAWPVAFKIADLAAFTDPSIWDDEMVVQDTSLGAGPTSHVSVVLRQSPFFNAKRIVQLTQGPQEFLNVASMSPFSSDVSGTGAAVTDGVGDVTIDHPGVALLSTGTTTTGRAAVRTNLDGIQPGGGRLYFMANLNIQTLSDGTNRFTTYLGFGDLVTGVPNDGIFFRQVDNVAGASWEAVCREDAVETAVDTAVNPVANTNQTFEIEVNAGATSVEFFINGASVATITTNIPDGTGDGTALQVNVIKALGTTARIIELDVINAYQELTTSR